MRMTLILMAGTAMMCVVYAYLSHLNLGPGDYAIDAGGRLAIGAVLALTTTLLYREARKNEPE